MTAAAAEDIQSLLDQVERSAGRKFMLRSDVANVLEGTANEAAKRQDLLFFSKFISNAHQVLSRAGMGQEESAALAKEFQQILQKVHDMISGLSIPGFDEKYVALTPHAMENFIALCRELAMIKNFELDKAHPGNQ